MHTEDMRRIIFLPLQTVRGFLCTVCMFLSSLQFPLTPKNMYSRLLSQQVIVIISLALYLEMGPCPAGAHCLRVTPAPSKDGSNAEDESPYDWCRWHQFQI